MSLSTKYPASIPEHVRPTRTEDLRSRELFEDISEHGLKGLLDHSRICRLGARRSLSPTRDGVDYIYVITDGYVAIWLASHLIPSGENFLAWRGPGQIIGEMRSIADRSSEARITTCEPCDFIEIKSDVLTQAAQDAPQIYRNVARLLMEKLHQERHRAEVIQMGSAQKKVAQTLLYLAEERRGKDTPTKSNVCSVPGIIHQDEIGAYIGAERETVNRVLCKFKSSKMITYTGNKHGCEVTILNRRGLDEITHEPSRRTDR